MHGSLRVKWTFAQISTNESQLEILIISGNIDICVKYFEGFVQRQFDFKFFIYYLCAVAVKQDCF